MDPIELYPDAVYLRLRTPEGWSDPQKCDLPILPREGEQFIDKDNRAFSVALVEWRLDLDQIHLFCEEYPLASEDPSSTMDRVARTLDQPMDVTYRQLLISAIFDVTIFGGAATLISRDWKVGLGTAVFGFLITVAVAPVLARVFRRYDD